MSFLNAAGLTRLKPLARWVVVGSAIAFLLHTLVRHWADISALRIGTQGWSLLVVALGVTLLAHTWAGWVWSWALQALQQPITGSWSAPVYLQTNLLKYLPGNVWHFFGRVRALRDIGVDNGSAIIGTALEPLLMAAAALSSRYRHPHPILALSASGLRRSPRHPVSPLAQPPSRSPQPLQNRQPTHRRFSPISPTLPSLLTFTRTYPLPPQTPPRPARLHRPARAGLLPSAKRRNPPGGWRLAQHHQRL